MADALYRTDGQIESRPARVYKRALSALERYSLVLQDVYHYQVDGIIEGVGHVDAATLQRAVDLAAAVNPAIRVRLRGRLGFARWVDSGIAPQVRSLPLTDWDGNSGESAPFLSERLDGLHGGPIADIVIVPCTDGKTRLVFRTMHAAIDGRGFLHWVWDVCRALRNEPLEGSDCALTDLDVQARYRDKLPKEPPAPLGSCISVLTPPTDPGPLKYIWRRVIVPNNVSQVMTKTAVFLAAWARRREPGEIGFTIPIDYRGLRIQDIGLGNLTGYIFVKVPEDATARGLMVQIQQQIRSFADCWSIPGARLIAWLPIWFMASQLRPKIDKILYKTGPALPTGGIVSMGNMKPETYSFPGYQADMIYGIPASIGKLNLVFLNYPDFVVATFSAPAAYNQNGEFDELIDAYREHLST